MAPLDSTPPTKKTPLPEASEHPATTATTTGDNKAGTVAAASDNTHAGDSGSHNPLTDVWNWGLGEAKAAWNGVTDLASRAVNYVDHATDRAFGMDVENFDQLYASVYTPTDGKGTKPTAGGGGDQTGPVERLPDGTVKDKSTDGKTYTRDASGTEHYHNDATGSDVTFDRRNKTGTEHNIAGTGIDQTETPLGSWKTLPDGRRIFASTQTLEEYRASHANDADKGIADGQLYMFKDGVAVTRHGDNVFTYHKGGKTEIQTPQGDVVSDNGKVTLNGQPVTPEQMAQIHALLRRDQHGRWDCGNGFHVDNDRRPAGPNDVKVHVDNATTKGEGADITVTPAVTPAEAQPGQPQAQAQAPATITFEVPNEFRTQTTYPPDGSSEAPHEVATDLRPDHQINGQSPILWDLNYGNQTDGSGFDLKVDGDPSGTNWGVDFSNNDTQLWDGTDLHFDNSGDLTDVTDYSGNEISIADREEAQDAADDNAVITSATAALLPQISDAATMIAETENPEEAGAAYGNIDAMENLISPLLSDPNADVQNHAAAAYAAAELQRGRVTQLADNAQRRRDQRDLEARQAEIFAFNGPDYLRGTESDPSVVVSQSSAA